MRRVQGDFAQETRYADDPAEMAQHWAAEGAQRLHVVDLDGARGGERLNAQVISKLIRSVSIPVQVGGGVRSLATARALLDEGADRVVVGTAAVEHPEVLSEWIAAVGADRLIVGVDARQGRVASHGWQNVTQLDVLTFCEQLVSLGVARVLYTDVGRDGMLHGPDIEVTRAIAALLKVIGSGGVASVDDLQKMADAGAEAAIIGTALYEGRLKLSDALETAAC